MNRLNYNDCDAACRPTSPCKTMRNNEYDRRCKRQRWVLTVMYTMHQLSARCNMAPQIALFSMLFETKLVCASVLQWIFARKYLIKSEIYMLALMSNH